MKAKDRELNTFLSRIQSFRLQIIIAVSISNIVYLMLVVVFALASKMTGLQTIVSAFVGGVLVFATNAMCISAYASTYRTRRPIPIPHLNYDALKQGDSRAGLLSFGVSTASFFLIVIGYFVLREAKADIFTIRSLVDFHSSGFTNIVYAGIVLPLAPAFAMIFTIRQADRIAKSVKQDSIDKSTASTRDDVKEVLVFCGSWLGLFTVVTFFVFLGAYVLNHFPAFNSNSPTKIGVVSTGIGYDWVGLIYGFTTTTTAISLLSGYIVCLGCGRFAAKHTQVGGCEESREGQG